MKGYIERVAIANKVLMTYCWVSGGEQRRRPLFLSRFTEPLFCIRCSRLGTNSYKNLNVAVTDIEEFIARATQEIRETITYISKFSIKFRL